MARACEEDPFSSFPVSRHSTPCSKSAQLESRAKVLAHNPFSSLGNGGWNSTTLTKQSSTPAVVASLGKPTQPSVAPSPAPSQQQQQQQQQQQYHHQHQYQSQLQPGLSSVQDTAGVSRSTLEPSGAVLLSTSASGESTPAVAGMTTTPSASALTATKARIQLLRSSRIAHCDPSPGGAGSTIPSTDTRSNSSSVKRSYFSHLLKKDPPDFLRPSPGGVTQQRPSSSKLLSQSPLRLLQTSHGQVGSRATPSSPLVNTWANPEKVRQAQQWHSQGPVNSRHAATPNEQRDNQPNFSANSALVEGQIDMGAAATATCARRIEPPQPIIAPREHRGPLQATNGALTSEMMHPSESFTPNNTSFYSSFGEELRFQVPRDARPSGVLLSSSDAVMHAQPDGEGPTASAVLPLTAGGLNKGGDGCSALPARKSTMSLENLRNSSFSHSSMNIIAGEQQEKQQERKQHQGIPPPPPAATAVAFTPGLTNGKRIMTLPLNMVDLSTRRGLHTPRDGDTGLRHCLARGLVQPTETEESPAPFPPSSGYSQDDIFAVVAPTPTAGALPSFDSPDPQTVAGAGNRLREGVGEDPLAAGSVPVVSEKVENVGEPQVNATVALSGGYHSGVDGVSSSCATMSMVERQGHVKKEPVVSPEVEAALQSATSAPAPTLPTRIITQRPRRQGSCVSQCLALFTSTGYVVTIFSVSHEGLSGSVKSHRIADVLSGQLETEAKPTKVGAQHVKALQALIGLPLMSHDGTGLPLTSLQDTVRRVPSVCPLLKEILMFMTRDPLPEWRAEGQKVLIEMLSSAAKEVAVANDAYPWNPLKSEPAHDASKGLQKIQQLLYGGDREAAVGVALEHHLHAHAIIIAMMCPKKEYYIEAIRAVVEQELDPFSPLAHAYCMFNEMPPPPFQPPPPPPPPNLSSVATQGTGGGTPSLQQSWVQHAAVLISNFTRESVERLIQLGDTLIGEGMVDEAHCCFLLVHLSPMGTASSDRPIQPRQKRLMDLLRVRLGVLGGFYHPQRSRVAFVSPNSTLLTDVLQRIRFHLESQTSTSTTLEQESERKPPQHGIPLCPEEYMVAFHYMQVLWLHEVGLHEEAMPLIDAVRRVVLPPPSQEISQYTLNHLILHGLAATATTATTTATTDEGRRAPPTLDRPTLKPPRGQQSVQPTLNTPPVPSLTPAVKAPSVPRLNGGRTANASEPQLPEQVAWAPKVEHLTHLGPPKHPFSRGAESTKSAMIVTPLPSMQSLSATGVPPASKQAMTPSQEKDVAESQNESDNNAKDTAHQQDVSRSSLQKPPNSRGFPVESKKEQQEQASSRRSNSIGAIIDFFRRGGSQDGTKEESKKMIINTEKPPQFDPATGRYLFAETEEEKKMAELVKAGPPKPSSLAAKAVAGGGSVNGPPPPLSLSSMRHPSSSVDPVVGRASSVRPMRAQYVDMFNTT